MLTPEIRSADEGRRYQPDSRAWHTTEVCCLPMPSKCAPSQYKGVYDRLKYSLVGLLFYYFMRERETTFKQFRGKKERKFSILEGCTASPYTSHS